MASKVVRRIVSTAKAGKPLGPYNQAVIVDKTMYTSGQLGLDPETGDLVPGGIGPQAEQTFKNLGAILEEAGATFNNVVKTTVFLADIKEWPAFNEIYAKHFTGSFPARSAFQVAALPKGARVEMEAVVVLGEISDS